MISIFKEGDYWRKQHKNHKIKSSLFITKIKLIDMNILKFQNKIAIESIKKYIFLTIKSY